MEKDEEDELLPATLRSDVDEVEGKHAGILTQLVSHIEGPLPVVVWSRRNVANRRRCLRAQRPIGGEKNLAADLLPQSRRDT